MTNDECQMTKEARKPKHGWPQRGEAATQNGPRLSPAAAGPIAMGCKINFETLHCIVAAAAGDGRGPLPNATAHAKNLQAWKYFVAAAAGDSRGPANSRHRPRILSYYRADRSFLGFGLRHSLVIRHSSFVIRRSP